MATIKLCCLKENSFINKIVLILFLLSSILCATEKLQLANELREEVYKRTTIAATSESLYPIDYSQSSEAIIKACDEQGLGLWCAGIAFIYYKKLKENNIDAFILSIGFPNEFTHAVVLVKINEKLYIEDPYLNYMFNEDLNQVLEKLKRKKTSEITTGKNKFRPVAIVKENKKEKNLWSIKIRNESIPSKTFNKTSIYLADTSLKSFQKYYNSDKEKKSFTRLKDLGFPKNYFYFYLFPFAVFGKDGYCEDVSSDSNEALLKKIIMIIKQPCDNT